MRKKFGTRDQAEAYRNTLKEVIISTKLTTFDEELLQTANYYDQAFQLHGYKNLADACSQWLIEVEQRGSSQSLLEL